MEGPLAAGAEEVVVAGGGKARAVPAEVAFVEGVGGEAGGELEADPFDAVKQRRRFGVGV